MIPYDFAVNLIMMEVSMFSDRIRTIREISCTFLEDFWLGNFF
jgi:hypothetical protein